MFGTASSPPPGLNVTCVGSLPVAYGEPETWVSMPADETEYTATVLLPVVAASNPPSGLNATVSALPATVNGEPETGVSAPPAATENTDTVPGPAFTSASRSPSGLNATH